MQQKELCYVCIIKKNYILLQVGLKQQTHNFYWIVFRISKLKLIWINENVVQAKNQSSDDSFPASKYLLSLLLFPVWKLIYLNRRLSGQNKTWRCHSGLHLSLFCDVLSNKQLKLINSEESANKSILKWILISCSWQKASSLKTSQTGMGCARPRTGGLCSEWLMQHMYRHSPVITLCNMPRADSVLLVSKPVQYN